MRGHAERIPSEHSGSFSKPRREAKQAARCSSRAHTNSRSTGVERFTPKFLKNWGTQLFQKYLGIRLASDTKAALLGFAEMSDSPGFSAVYQFQLHFADTGSRRLIPSCVHLNATWYQAANDLAACPIGAFGSSFRSISFANHCQPLATPESLAAPNLLGFADALMIVSWHYSSSTYCRLNCYARICLQTMVAIVRRRALPAVKRTIKAQIAIVATRDSIMRCHYLG